ncbi:MAG: multidrug resistance efflux transporter family protein, partial [Oscillospiraceae bacterium]|nr:multidrug resistance efflux transporter family protein [Oscillospiraceae bacterium]
CSLIILIGIALLQAGKIKDGGRGSLLALLLILIAAAAYPLGNRKMMSHAPEDITTTERVFGMTLCSMPFWIISALIAGLVSGPPSGGQCLQSLIVALFSGVIATLLFFEATKLVKNDAPALALVEASQCGEVIFTLLGGILFLSDALPSGLGILGLIIVVGGMTANSLVRE